MDGEVVHVGQHVDCPAEPVYAFAREPANLSRWAAGLAAVPGHQEGGSWVLDTPAGRVEVDFEPVNPYGVLDHWVRMPDGSRTRNPFRVLADGDGCDLVFTLRRADGVPEQAFEADVTAVRADLARLARICEEGDGVPPATG